MQNKPEQDRNQEATVYLVSWRAEQSFSALSAELEVRFQAPSSLVSYRETSMSDARML